VAGAGGPLGAAVLERTLASGVFQPVQVLVTQALGTTLRHFVPRLVPASLAEVPAEPLNAHTALLVLDRERASNGREAAFHRPLPEQVAPLARWLHAGGVKRLVVVLPHAPGLLPAALKAGLATLDEQAVAALGFEQVVFVRPARLGGGSEPALQALQRLARALLSQLNWLLPQREQPLRADKVAQFAVDVAWLLAQLPGLPHGTRVAPPELLWQVAQAPDGAALLGDWLAGRALPEAAEPRRRM
jgi:hypothetical protein